MDQKPALLIAILLAAVVLAAIAGAGVMTFGTSTPDPTQDPAILHKPGAGTRDLFPEKAYPEYATGYSVEYHGTYKVVRIHDPWGRSAGNHTYLLVERGEAVPDSYPNARIFRIPVQSVITLSVSQVAHLSALNETPSIAGHNGLAHIIDEGFRARAGAGEIAEIGSGTLSMNNPLKTETMIELGPDLVFCSASGYPEYDNQQKLVEAGLKPVVVADWMEDDPLARAEWIKFYALFFNKEQEADAFFQSVEENYRSIREKAVGVREKPTIFSGLEYQGTWYAPAGGSYVARLFSDAGGDYILVNDSGSGDIPLDFEVVYDRAHAADYYINVGYVTGAEDLLARDPRYAKFDAVKRGAIYHFDARTNEYGSLDYWQSGSIHPDIILADLVKILHPDLLPDHELYFYRHVSAGMSGGSS
jgi:iron complex transport system substrate-binding protein